MSNTKDLEYILDGIRVSLQNISNELLNIRKIMEREENNKSMILQKVDNENNNFRLR